MGQKVNPHGLRVGVIKDWDSRWYAREDKVGDLIVEDYKIREYLNPLVIIAYTIFVGTTFLSIYAYKGIPLSMGPVLEATSYIYVTVFGVTIFKEKLNKLKLVGLALIIAGIIIYSLLG